MKQKLKWAIILKNIIYAMHAKEKKIGTLTFGGKGNLFFRFSGLGFWKTAVLSKQNLLFLPQM